MRLGQFRMCSLYIAVTNFDIYSCLKQGHQSFPYSDKKGRTYADIQLEDKMFSNITQTKKKQKKRKIRSLYKVCMYV